MIVYKVFEMRFLDQVLELLEPLWGHLSMAQREAYFKWKYIENPNIDEIIAYIAIESESEIVVGFRGYHVLNFRKGGDSFFIASFSDAIMSKEYMGKGIFKKLTKYSIEHLNQESKLSCLNSISSNKNSNSSYYKLKSKKLSERTKLYRVSKLNKKIKKNVFSVEFNKNRSSEEIQFLANSCLNGSKFCFSYNLEQIRWRYNNPNTDYNFVYLRDDNNQLVAYISYYKIDSKRIHVIDYMYNSIEELKIALSELEKREINLLILIETFSSFEESLLLDLNFRRLTLVKKLLKKPLFNDIVIRPLKIDYTPNDWIIEGVDIRNIDNWHLSLICSDGI